MSEQKKRKLSVVVPPNTATPEELAKLLLRPVRRPDVEAKSADRGEPRDAGEAKQTE